jgi:hypothetical protein
VEITRKPVVIKRQCTGPRFPDSHFKIHLPWYIIFVFHFSLFLYYTISFLIIFILYHFISHYIIFNNNKSNCRTRSILSLKVKMVYIFDRLKPVIYRHVITSKSTLWWSDKLKRESKYLNTVLFTNVK